MSRTEAQPAGVGLPHDADLPLFVYGNLKPGELGHAQVAEIVASTADASVEGTLWERDGMPLLRLGPGDLVRGSVLRFASDAAYERVGRFEPATHYAWSTATVDDEPLNMLVARPEIDPARDGANVLRGTPWSTARDPLFQFGLATVAQVLRTDGLTPFGEPHEPEEWARHYRLQSALMLTFSALERITSRVISGKRTTAAVNALGRTEEFVRAVEAVGLQNEGRKVFQAHNPSKGESLSKPHQFAAWAYQIRNNLMHQGKSARSEAELVRTTLLDLHDVLRVYLLDMLPALEHGWSLSDPDGCATSWRVKPRH